MGIPVNEKMTMQDRCGQSNDLPPVLQFYQHLLKEKEMQINTLETIHTVLHPTFQLKIMSIGDYLS